MPAEPLITEGEARMTVGETRRSFLTLGGIVEETIILKELLIEDVSPDETDEELWTWLVDTVLNPNGIPVFPWTRHSLTRSGTTATVTLDLRLDPEDKPKVN
jgi:hypothetical protein